MRTRLPHSLKAKLALGGGLAVCALIVALTSWAVFAMQEDVRRSALDAQHALVQQVASNLDREIAERERAVGLVAATFSLGDELPDEFEIGADLLRNPLLTEHFHVLFVADRQGRIVFDTPHLAGRRGNSVANRPYFRQVAESGKPVISDPFLGQTTQQPMLVFAAPVRSRDGRFVGMVGGGVFLGRDSFLSAPMRAGVSRAGRFMLVSKGAAPSFVAHPQAGRVLTAASNERWMAQAIQFVEGSHEGVDENGESALLAYRTLQAVPWQLVSVYPAAEAYASLRSRQAQLWLVATAVGLACALALWLVTRRLLAPVDQLRATMQRAVENGSAVPVVEAGSSELQALASAYNRLQQRRAESERALLERTRILRDVTDNVPALIAFFDAQECCQFANAHASTVHGIAREEITRHTLRSMLGEAAYDAHRMHIERVLSGHRMSFEGHWTLDGRTIDHHTTMLPQFDTEGAVTGFYVMSSDVTKMKQVQRELETLARFDALTGLPNRRHFMEKLAEALARARRSGLGVALLFLDIDHFKTINDSRGHAAGDAVLREFALRLERCVREVDTVARQGGDEFVVLLEGQHGPDESQFAARKILAQMARPFVVDGRTLSVGTSVGVAFDARCTGAPAELLDAADGALYTAKRDGRNTFRLATAAGLQ